MPVLDGIFATLPCQFRLQILRVRGKVQRLHACKNSLYSVHGNESAQIAQNTTEESINVDSFSMHNVGTRDHFQELGKSMSLDIERDERIGERGRSIQRVEKSLLQKVQRTVVNTTLQGCFPKVGTKLFQHNLNRQIDHAIADAIWNF